MNRWTSRKFLTSLIAQLAAIAVLLWPEHESTIVEGSTSLAALLVLALTTLGYVKEEGAIDRERAQQGAPR